METFSFFVNVRGGGHVRFGSLLDAHCGVQSRMPFNSTCSMFNARVGARKNLGEGARIEVGKCFFGIRDTVQRYQDLRARVLEDHGDIAD